MLLYDYSLILTQNLISKSAKLSECYHIIHMNANVNAFELRIERNHILEKHLILERPVFQLYGNLLTLKDPCISESCIEIFIFTLLCGAAKRFYEGL